MTNEKQTDRWSYVWLGIAVVFLLFSGAFRILCQRKVAWFIRSKIEHGIKSTFEKDRELRYGESPVLYRHRPLLAGIVNAHEQ